jgi:hypothetical protein
MSVKNSNDVSILDGLSSFVFTISAYKSYYTPNFYWKLTNTTLILSSFLCNMYKTNIYFLLFDYAVIYAISTTYIIFQNIPSSPSPYNVHVSSPSYTKETVGVNNGKYQNMIFETAQHQFAKCSLIGIFLCGVYYYYAPVYDVFLLLKQFFNIIKNVSVVFSFYLCHRNTPEMWVPLTVALICYGVKTHIIQYIISHTDSHYYRIYIIYYWTTWLWHFSIATILYFSSNHLPKKGGRILSV